MKQNLILRINKVFYYLLTSSYTNQIYYVKTKEEIKGLIQATGKMRREGKINVYQYITGLIPISKERYKKENAAARSQDDFN